MQKLILIAVSGAMGTLARYGLNNLTGKICKAGFPAGTLIINIIGCLLFGIVFALIEKYAHFTSNMKYYVLIGFMGAFTTFSAFAYESFFMLKSGNYFHAFLNIAMHIIIGIIMIFAGIKLVEMF